MSFREKVKAIVEEKTVTMAHPESQKAGTQGPGGAIKVTPEEVEKYTAKGWVPVKKSKLTDNTHPYYKKVKALLETDEPDWGQPGSAMPSGRLKGSYDPKISDERVKAKKQRSSDSMMRKVLAALRAKKSQSNGNGEESQTENSNQKVKELSRGNKKNKSLLERKSKIRFLLARIDPNEKKSKPTKPTNEDSENRDKKIADNELLKQAEKITARRERQARIKKRPGYKPSEDQTKKDLRKQAASEKGYRDHLRSMGLYHGDEIEDID